MWIAYWAICQWAATLLWSQSLLFILIFMASGSRGEEERGSNKATRYNLYKANMSIFPSQNYEDDIECMCVWDNVHVNFNVQDKKLSHRKHFAESVWIK